MFEERFQFTSHETINGKAEGCKITVVGLTSFRVLPLLSFSAVVKTLKGVLLEYEGESVSTIWISNIVVHWCWHTPLTARSATRPSVD